MTDRLPSFSAAATSGARSAAPDADGAKDGGPPAAIDGSAEPPDGAGGAVPPQAAATSAAIAMNAATRVPLVRRGGALARAGGVAAAGIEAPGSRAGRTTTSPPSRRDRHPRRRASILTVIAHATVPAGQVRPSASHRHGDEIR